MYNAYALQIWDGLFANVPNEWRQAPPSRAMQTCAEWLRHVGARDILDAGCGVGRWSVWLAGQGFHVWGADFAPQGVKYAQQWAVDEGLDITFVCAPITDYAFPGRQFDAVVAALVLDLVSTEEFETAVEVFGTALGSTGHLFAVFNPSEKPAEAVENPTAGVTLIQYSDSEIEEIVAKAGYYLVRRKVLDQDTRGFLWRRDPSSA